VGPIKSSVTGNPTAFSHRRSWLSARRVLTAEGESILPLRGTVYICQYRRRDATDPSFSPKRLRTRDIDGGQDRVVGYGWRVSWVMERRSFATARPVSFDRHVAVLQWPIQEEWVRSRDPWRLLAPTSLMPRWIGIKPPIATDHFYSGGFTTMVAMTGGRYITPKAGVPSVAGTTLVTLGGGNPREQSGQDRGRRCVWQRHGTGRPVVTS